MNPIVCNGNKLRWKFDNIKDLTKDHVRSDKFKIGPVDWIIKVNLHTQEKQDYFTVYLDYDSENKTTKNWICEMNGEYKVLAQCGTEKHLILSRYTFFHFDFLRRGLRFKKLSDMTSNDTYIRNNSMIVEIDFNFRYYDFSKSIENVTDMIITIDDTEFHLNKWALASRSEYFKNLIINSKPNDVKSVKLEDIQAQDFCVMLASLYPFFRTDLENKYIDLIKVAKKYGVSSLHHLCEQYLITQNKREIIDKLELADENDYEELKKNIVESLKTASSIKHLHADPRFLGLKDATKWKIMNHLLDLV